MNTRNLVWLSIPAALSLLSCGDAVAPPAEGAVGLTVKPSGDAAAGYSCGAAHQIVLGAAAPSPGSRGVPWTDGQDGHNVSCSVTGNGNFTVKGSISGESANFLLDGTVTAGGTGQALVALFDPNQQLAMTDSTCTMHVDGDYKVEKGAIWGAVSCSRLKSDGDMFLWCALNATFVFKNCAD